MGSLEHVRLEATWRSALADELTKPYVVDLDAFVAAERASGQVVYPPAALVFAAFANTPFDAVRVVILGQDPYHAAGQATGLAFSVPRERRIPPSLRNIYAELAADLAIQPPEHGDLTGWAQQGVLLLNSVLTVRAGEAGSHAARGWERFTDAAVRALAEQREGLVFALWGRYAQAKGAFIDRERHLVLEAAHPSPLSARNGFFGCQHFSRTNAWLADHDAPPIDWSLPR